MRAFVLQDWVTIRGAAGVQTVVQNESNYLSLDAYQDVVFWLQVSEATVNASTITLNYDTAPLKDETLFQPMATATITTISMPTPTITKVIAAAATTTTPLSRWVRWRLGFASNATSWDLTFRVLVAGNQLFAVNPPNTWSPMGGWGSGG